jgi:hypothetical protein
MAKLKEFLKNLIPTKQDAYSLTVSLAIVIIFLAGYKLLGNRFVEDLWLINFVLLAILLSVIMIIAGFAVLKALFFVAAELSLLIFLAQSYCAIPSRLDAGNQALKSLLAIGLLYIAVSFCRSLYKGLKKHYKSIKNERWSKEKTTAVSAFLIFTGLFIWQIYLVVNPIILNLCVYK